jgi:hypothetical protein
MFPVPDRLGSEMYFTEALFPPDPSNAGYAVNAITQRTGFGITGGTVNFIGYQQARVVTAFNFLPGAPFNSASVTSNAIAVLHEVGHIYEDLYGPGSTLLVNDSVQAQGSIAGSDSASAYNTKLVQANCFLGAIDANGSLAFPRRRHCGPLC